MVDSKFTLIPIVEPELDRGLVISSLVVMVLTADFSSVVVTIGVKALAITNIRSEINRVTSTVGRRSKESKLVLQHA